MYTATEAMTCRLCAGPDLRTVLELAPTPWGQQFLDEPDLDAPLFDSTLMECVSCGHVQHRTVVEPDEVAYHAPDELTGDSPGMVAHLERYAADVARFLEDGDRVVDIGSNDGTFLSLLRARAREDGKEIHVLGVEPSLIPVAEAARKGIPSLPRPFGRLEAAYIGPKAKLVTANRVIANIPNLQNFVLSVRDLLTPDGVFVFETGYLPDILSKNLVDTIYHEHIAYDRVSEWAKVLPDFGLELFDVTHNNMKGGSIRCYVQRQGGPWPKVYDGWIDDKVDFDAFKARVNAEGQRIHAEIYGLQTVAGFGASVGTVTQIFQWGLQNEINYLADDNSRNWGKWVPGTWIKVHKPGFLTSHHRMGDGIPHAPQAIVIFAWRYADQIMERHSEYKGKWIVPFPPVAYEITSDITAPVS